MTEKYQLVKNPVQPITCHAWNADRSLLAISPNNNEVNVLQAKGGSYDTLFTLKEHGQRVMGIDWAPKSNRIVTCGQDRNAYVWNLEGKEWKPTLVLLRMHRAATCVKWSPSEKKFAVGSGSRLVAICYFEEEHDWWVSKHIKKPIRSTVLSVDWHPNDYLVACGSSDFKCRVFSAYVKEIEEKPKGTTWGKKLPFGELLGEFGSGIGGGGWVHGVSFSPSGDRLAYVGHDSAITVVDSTQENKMFRVETKILPLRCVQWATENSIIAAGHDYAPYLFAFNGSALNLAGKLDGHTKAASKEPMGALAKFQTLDRKGTSGGDAVDVAVDTIHQNAISQISVYSGGPTVTKFATGGVDGQLIIWDLAASAAAAKLTIA